MNYNKHYSVLIEKAQNRSILPNEYKEIHHIIPKCLGGSNDKNNLVALFPEEHLVAHLLLAKIHKDNEKLACAAFAMVNGMNRCKSKIKHNNKQYGWIKRQFSRMQSEKYSQNNPYSQYKGMTYEEMFGEEEAKRRKANYKRWLQENGNPFLGKKHSNETKQKLSIAASRRVQPEETKAKIKATLTSENFWSDEEKEKRRDRVSGAGNPKAKSWILIDPQGHQFSVKGGFDKFLKDRNLSRYTAEKWINKGVIHTIINTTSEKSFNLIGWEIKCLDD